MKRPCPGMQETGSGMDRRTFIKGSAVAAAGLFAVSYPRLGHAQPRPLIVDVENVPVPDFSSSNLHPGVEAALRTLFCAGVPFYKADSKYPLSDPGSGLIARDDVVLVKVNGQWQYRGVTNSDVVRGVVQRVLDHPEGFAGEVVIFENGQNWGSLDCNLSWPGNYPDNLVHANAEDESHSFQYLIDQVFNEPRVSGYLLDPIRRNWIGATEHVDDGYRQAGIASYPCFTTAGGVRVELMEGIWDGAGYAQNLKLINIPVFKHHDGSAVTGALKHVYGILSTDYQPVNYHYSQIGNVTGDMHTLVRTPALNLIDCIWVSHGNLAGYPASNTTRTNRLLAGFDPVALDYYAGKHILYPAGLQSYHNPDTSADFRNFLTQAQDRINANGGINGEPVTFDETAFDVVRGDASASPAPSGTLRIVKADPDVRLEWEGGAPPFRVWRSPNKDFSDPTLLTDCCLENNFNDAGALRDGIAYLYRVD